MAVSQKIQIPESQLEKSAPYVVADQQQQVVVSEERIPVTSTVFSQTSKRKSISPACNLKSNASDCLNSVPLSSKDGVAAKRVIGILEEDSSKLDKAFEQFSRLGKEIVNSYSTMEQKVEALNEELEWVTNQRIAEYEEKKALASRLQELLSILPSAVIVIDGRGRISQVNLVAESLLGSSILDKRWSEIVQLMFEQNSNDGIEASLIDGRRLHVSTCPLTSEKGQLVVLTDVTDMHKLQNRVGRNRRLAGIGKAMASMSHQIRTPLSAALIYASHLQNNSLKEDFRQNMAKKLQGRLLQMNEQIEDMLLFARGGMEQAKSFEINSWWSELNKQLTEIAQLHPVNCQISNNIAKNITLYANAQALNEAITNLLVNACEALENTSNAQIEISINQIKNQFQLTVSDNGPGVPASVRHDLFDPFVSCKPKGTGLGLSVVQSVVLSAGGTIKWNNKKDGGALFTLTLPLAQELQVDQNELQQSQKSDCLEEQKS